MPGNEERTERNWYKVTTIVLSAAMVGIMFVSGIYYKRLDDKRSTLNKIDDKIDELLDRRQDLTLVPKVRVDLQTLQDCGLPDDAFEGLPDVPAVLHVEHVGGQTARGITVEVSSTFEMLGFSPETSVENFSYRIDQEDNRLLLTIPQLRRGSVIQGTIKCARVGRLSKRTRIDTGVVVARDAEDGPLETRLGLKLGDLDEIHPPSYSSPAQIDRTVELLRLLSKVERERSIIEGVPSFAKVFLASILPLIGAVGIGLSRDYLKGKKGHELGNRIGAADNRGAIKIGMEKSALVDLVGPPHRKRSVHEKDGPVEIWEYEPPASLFFGWQPDLFVTLRDERIAEYEFKQYGDRQYS